MKTLQIIVEIISVDVTVKRREERRAGPQPCCSSSPTSSAPFLILKPFYLQFFFVNLGERFCSQCSALTFGDTGKKKSLIQQRKNFLWTRTLENSLCETYFSQTDRMTSCHLETCVIPLCLPRQSYCTSEIHLKASFPKEKNLQSEWLSNFRLVQMTFVSLSTNISLNLSPALLSSLTLYLVKKHTDTCTPLFLSQ